MRITMRTVYDTIRKRKTNSIREAWESYHPEMQYSTFYYMLRTGKFKSLKVEYEYSSRVITPTHVNKKTVVDLDTCETWNSITECAKSLGVSYQAIQLAIKRKNLCKGRVLSIVERES